MFSAMPKAKGRRGGCAATACASLCAERSGTTMFAEEALHIASDDDDLHWQIVELQAQS